MTPCASSSSPIHQSPSWVLPSIVDSCDWTANRFSALSFLQTGETEELKSRQSEPGAKSPCASSDSYTLRRASGGSMPSSFLHRGSSRNLSLNTNTNSTTTTGGVPPSPRPRLSKDLYSPLDEGTIPSNIVNNIQGPSQCDRSPRVKAHSTPPPKRRNSSTETLRKRQVRVDWLR